MGRKFVRHDAGMFILYAELGRLHMESRKFQKIGWFRWRMYPKHHLFIHCCEDVVASAGNLRDCWCYRDENEIGLAVDVAESGHATTLHRTVVEKYCL